MRKPVSSFRKKDEAAFPDELTPFLLCGKLYVYSKESLHKSSVAEQRIFCAIGAVSKTGNTHRISLFWGPSQISRCQHLPTDSELPQQKRSDTK